MINENWKMKLEIFILLPLAFVQLSYTANMFFLSMKFVGVNVTHNPEYYSNVTAWIQNGSLNAEIESIKRLITGLRGNVETQIKLTGAKRYQTLFSYDCDMCKMLNEQVRDSLLKNWFRNILKYSNLMQNCPIMEGHYYIRNFILEAGSIPAYLRIGDYRLNVYAYMGKLKTKKEKLIMRVVTDMQIY